MSFSLIALVYSALCRATSVTPPSFSELVDEAQVIARGTVTSVSSRWVESSRGPLIKTFVTVAVEKRLKGEAPDTLTLELLGGTVGSDKLHVSGMPEFKPGDHEIVFVQGNGVQFCPLVRFGHGRYHVRSDDATNRHYVARNDDTPLTSTTEIQTPVEDHDHGVPKRMRSAAAALTPEDFETEIRSEVARHSR